MTEIERLRKAVRDLHGVDSTHLRSEPVHETFRGQTVWEAVVEVFALKEHPKATVVPGVTRRTRVTVASWRCSACRRSTVRRRPCGRRSLPKRIDREEGKHDIPRLRGAVPFRFRGALAP